MNDEKLPMSPNLHSVARRLGLDPEEVDIDDVLGYIDTLKCCLHDASERVEELLLHMPRDPHKKATRPLSTRRDTHLIAIKQYHNYASRSGSKI